jgi:hypothetical protein
MAYFYFVAKSPYFTLPPKSERVVSIEALEANL